LALRANNMSKDERYREKNKTIRQLKAQVRHLRKELRLVHSELALIKELWEKDVIDMAKKQRRKNIENKKKDVCPECGNPTITHTVIGIWNLTRCDACDYFDRKQTDDTD